MSAFSKDHRRETILLFIIVLVSIYIGGRIGELFDNRIITVFATFGLVLILYTVARLILDQVKMDWYFSLITENWNCVCNQISKFFKFFFSGLHWFILIMKKQSLISGWASQKNKRQVKLTRILGNLGSVLKRSESLPSCSGRIKLPDILTFILTSATRRGKSDC